MDSDDPPDEGEALDAAASAAVQIDAPPSARSEFGVRDSAASARQRT